MKERLIIEGNAVYEIDEECMHQMQKEQKEMEAQQEDKKKNNVDKKNQR